MNRAERRRQEKQQRKTADQKQKVFQQYENRTQFTKVEAEEMNQVAYLLGVRWALQAARDVTGYGETRMHRIAARVKEIEKQELTNVPSWSFYIQEKDVVLSVNGKILG